MVTDTLVHHPTVAHYLRFVATTAGRDKLLRILQYFARFYSWYLLRTNGTPAQMAPWRAIKAQFGLVRKILRVGKNVEHLKAAASVSASSSSPPSSSGSLLRYAAVGRQVGYAGYLTLDSLTVPDAAGIRPWKSAPAVQKHASRFWAAALACSVVTQTLTLYRLKQREAAIDRKDGEGVVEAKRITKERAASQLQLINDLADLTIPVSALGWLNLDDGIVGLAGTLGSAIGLYTQWKKTA